MDQFYGQNISYIHLKFGDMHKMYNFTDGFRAEHPNFCAEYEKYWNGDKDCRFKSALEIAQYTNMFDVPIRYYYNFIDEPSKGIEDVFEYFLTEYAGITREADGKFRDDYLKGLDGEEANNKQYKVIKA